MKKSLLKSIIAIIIAISLENIQTIMAQGNNSGFTYTENGISYYMTVTTQATGEGIANAGQVSISINSSSISFNGEITLPSTYISNTWSSGETAQTLFYKVTSIADYGFGNSNQDNASKLTKITIPSNITNIGHHAFNNCTALQEVIMTNSVENIGTTAFSQCLSLTKINLPTNLVYNKIQMYLFQNCQSLESITIPNNIKEISANAFYGCKKLNNVVIPNSVSILHSSCFSYCSSLSNISFASGNETNKLFLSNSLFTNCPFTSIELPCRLDNTQDWGTAFGGQDKLQAVTIQSCLGTSNYALDQNIIYNSTYTAIYYCPSAQTNITEYSLKNTTKEIKKGAFISNKTLNKIILNNTLISIKDSAFFNSHIKEINIPKSVTILGKNVFELSLQLQKIQFSNDNTTNIKIIPNNTFKQCFNLELTDNKIPNGVEEIHRNAFAVCDNLVKTTNKLIIPSTVKLIDGNINDISYGSITSISIKEIIMEEGDGTNPLTIKVNAFNSNSNLETINIPCRSNGNWTPIAFSNCSKLKTINICDLDDDYTVDAYGIIYTSDYKTLLLCPGGLTITDYTVHNDCSLIESNAFNNNMTLKNINLNNVTQVNNTVFYRAKNLKSVQANNLERIGRNAFSSCRNLESINIPQVTFIDEYCFTDCSSLTSIIFNDNLLSIPASCFHNCSKLTSVTLPKNLKQISMSAFYNCSLLTSISIPNAVTNIFNYAFKGTNLRDITIEDGENTNLTIYVTSLSGLPDDLVITCMNHTPPKTSGASSNIKNTWTIKCPCSALEAYVSSTIWQNVGTIEPISTDEQIEIVYDNILLKKDLYKKINNVISSADCGYSFKNKVTIKDGGSITFNERLNKPSQQSIATNIKNSQFIVETNMNFESWNLIGMMGTSATYQIFNNNYGNNSFKSHDVAAAPYLFKENKWSNDFPFHYESTPNSNNENYSAVFIYPFENSLLMTDNDGNIVYTIDENNPNGYVKIIDDNGEDNYTIMPLSITGNNVNELQGSNTGVFDITLNTDGDLVNNAYWYVVSNPFLCRLDIAKLIQNQNFQGNGIRTYNNGWSNVLTKGYLKPGQAFIVETNSSTKYRKIDFNLYDMMYKNDFLAVKNSIATNPITFISVANNAERNAYAIMKETASNGFDINDAHILFSNNRQDLVEPYFIIGNDLLSNNVFQTLPYECPIGFHASKYSNVEFRVENVPNDIDIILIDKAENNKETLLSDGTSYNFNVFEGENTNRFIVRFAKKNIGINESTIQNNNITIHTADNDIFINGSNLKNLQIINPLGQVVVERKLNGNSYQGRLDLPSGAYIIKVTSNNSSVTKTVIK